MPPYTPDEIGFIRLLERCEAMLLSSRGHAFSLGEDLALKMPVFISYLISFIESRERETVVACEFVQRHKPRVEALNQSLMKWETSKRRDTEGDLPHDSRLLITGTQTYDS